MKVRIVGGQHELFDLHDLESLLGRLRDESRADRPPSILIQGETGTGKRLLARVIHEAGPRRDEPLLEVNVAAIPSDLLEAELCGFAAGAFASDARRGRAGLFQAAHRGTVILAGMDSLPSALQAKLVRMLDERGVRRLGSARPEPADVCIVGTTSRSWDRAVRDGQFREDLYHRLATVCLELPPLRERSGEDILALADHFLERVSVEHGVPLKHLTPDARAALLAYRWPGNVRELSNVIERAVVVARGAELTAEALGLDRFERAAQIPPSSTVSTSLDAGLRGHLQQVLSKTDWNITRAAALLGISRSMLRTRIRRYGLRRG